MPTPVSPGYLGTRVKCKICMHTSPAADEVPKAPRNEEAEMEEWIKELDQQIEKEDLVKQKRNEMKKEFRKNTYNYQVLCQPESYPCIKNTSMDTPVEQSQTTPPPAPLASQKSGLSFFPKTSQSQSHESSKNPRMVQSKFNMSSFIQK